MSSAEREWEEIRERVLERDGHECRFCGTADSEHREENGRSLDVHHIIPRRDGGANRMRNLAALCRSCHSTMETLHGQAMRELEAEKELAENVASLMESLSISASEDWGELFGGPFVPGFFRDDDGRGVYLADTSDFEPRERACFHAGRVEAYWDAGEQLRAVLEGADTGVDLRHRFQLPHWSSHIVRCECGERVDTRRRDECPGCGSGDVDES